MDPEMFGPVIAGALALLSLMGARRQHHREPGNGPTAGQHLSEIGTQFASGGSTAIQRVGTFTTNTTVSAAESVVGATTAVAAGAGRLAGRSASAVAGTVAGVAGQTLANGGGLVLDGVAALTNGLISPLRRRSPRASVAAPSRVARPAVVVGSASSEERPAARATKTPVKKAATRRTVAKKAPVKRTPATKPPARKATSRKAANNKAPVRRTAAKKR